MVVCPNYLKRDGNFDKLSKWLRLIPGANDSHHFYVPVVSLMENVHSSTPLAKYLGLAPKLRKGTHTPNVRLNAKDFDTVGSRDSCALSDRDFPLSKLV